MPLIRTWFKSVGLPMLATIGLGLLLCVALTKGDFSTFPAVWYDNLPQTAFDVTLATFFLSIGWARAESGKTTKERIIKWFVIVTWAVLSLTAISYILICQ